jgi:hypothetical protein
MNITIGREPTQVERMTDRELVQFLRAAGFALCKPDRAEKKPTDRGWPTRSLEPDDFTPDDMVGVIGGPLSAGGKPGHALVILDLDTPDAVAAADDYLPPTAMAEGRAGKPRSHRYFLVPVCSIPAWGISHAPLAAPAAMEQTGHAGPFLKSFRHRETKREVIRFLGTGGQAVCPPSIWRSDDGTRTEPREWADRVPGEPAVVPFLDLWDATCRLASRCGAGIPEVVPRPARTSAPRADSANRTLDRARKYLAKCEPAVSGQGGHNATFRAACVLVQGFDLDPEDAYGLLATDYNPRCQPQWSERELRHKVEDADRVPSRHPRGRLRDAERDDRPTPARREPRPHAVTPAADPSPAAPTHPAVMIRKYWEDTYRPAYRVGNRVVCEDGEDLTQAVACSGAPTKLIDLLATAEHAPLYRGGGVNASALPGFFKKWAPTAWADMRDALPTEDEAEISLDAPVAEEFRRMVRDALLTEVTLGESDDRGRLLPAERLAVIEWARRFAKARWANVRSKVVYSRCENLGVGLLRLSVAIHHALFAQLPGGDRRLREMSTDQFNRRCAKYGVGRVPRDERPGGQRMVVLDREFLEDLLGLLNGSALPPDEVDRAAA